MTSTKPKEIIECRFIITVEDIKFFKHLRDSETDTQLKEKYAELLEDVTYTLVMIQTGPIPDKVLERLNKLQELTGFSIMECRKALLLCENHLYLSVSYLTFMKNLNETETNPNSAEDTYSNSLEQLEMETRNEDSSN